MILREAAALLVIGAIVTTLALAGRTPTGDGPHLAATTLAMAESARHGEIGAALATFATRVSPQPPLGYLPGILASLAVGERWLAMLLVGGFALWLCWDALGRLGGRAAAWAPGLVLVASPLTWLYVEQYGWDLLTAAAALQAIAWLAASDGLRRGRAAIGFGLWMGVGFLTKYTFPMFLWLPCLFEGARLLGAADRGPRLRGLGRAMGMFAILVVPWLLLNGGELAGYLGHSVGADAIAAVESSRAGANRFSAASLSLYPLAIKDALGWPGLVVLGGVGGVGAIVARREGERENPARLALLGALGGLLVLSGLEQSQDRYALPAVALLSALALGVGRLPYGQEAFVGVFVVQLLGTFSTFRPGAAATSAPRFDHPLSSAGALSWPRSRSYLPTTLDLDAWHIDAALVALADPLVDGPRVVAMVLPDDPMMPEPGIYLLRAQTLDLPLDLRIYRPRADRPPREGWPPSDTAAVYVAWQPGRDVAVEGWVSGRERAPTWTFTLPAHARSAVYATEERSE